MKEKNVYNEIWIKEIKKRTPIYIIGIIFHIVTIIINLITPLIIGNILDMLILGAPKEELLKKSIYLIVLLILHIIPRCIYRYCYFTNARTSDSYLRKKVIEHLQKVLPEYYEKEEKGTYLAYLSRELLLTIKSFGNIYHYITCIIVGCIITSVYIIYKFSIIVGIVIIPILIGVILYITVQYKSLEKKLENYRKEFIDLSKSIQRNTDGFTLIKMYNEQKNEKVKFDNINSKTHKANIEIGIVKNKISNGMNIAYSSIYILTFVIGLFLIKNNVITVGLLIGVIGALEFVLSDIMNSIIPLLDGIGYYKQAKNRYNYFYNLNTYKNNGKLLKDVQNIEIKNLTYSFDNKNNILENINIKIEKGEKIGIIGQVGSGKTVLMNIIARILPNT